MASESSASLSPVLLDELRAVIDARGSAQSVSVMPGTPPPELLRLHGRALPARPLAVAVDVYGTLLASAIGEVGLASSSLVGAASGKNFPPDTADRLRAIIAEDHARSRSLGIPYPEVDAPSVFSRALELDREGGARACVEWECAANPSAPMPGAAAFLAACAAGRLPYGIVSNAQFYTRLFLETAFGVPLISGFDPELVLWSFESGRAKPDPWMFEELARRLGARGIPRARILYVGNDALNDCAAAGESGLMTALFAGDAVSFKPRLGDPRAAARPPSTLVLSWDELSALVFSS